MRRILVQEEDFDIAAETARLSVPDVGGIASFIGTVRADRDGAHCVTALRLEHYPGMTEKALAAIAAEAEARWHLTGCTIIHRVGRLVPGDNIVFVAAASAHRAAALQATSFLIDWLKTGAPFWKAEELENGETAWVEARASDDAAAAAWKG
jgi:molybdopterin synthase catalytic subunit